MRKLMTVVLASAGLTLIAGTAAVGIITATATPAPAPMDEPAQTKLMVEGESTRIAVESEPAPATEGAPAPGATPATETMVMFEYTLSAEEQALVDEGNTYPPDTLIPDALNTAIGALQDRIITACMTASGFDYLAYLAATAGDGETGAAAMDQWIRSGVDPTAFFAALYGEQTDEPYDWTRAGCVGYAVHITGMDDQH
ncbi:hypothetical protein CLV46_2489 [Diaminobutyricimonas aerilata]|uniref:Uncharacterized protein n=1 Tax=Diaminobutyricimonas aerilata TaxID=1162967 RepID=A0A2M9CLY9_9MICO|nr:hypothetical protein [Diaminobutyricimonas aerilata]PJJ72910.1 hypothetical protein CLV46_2489 [Diaminobutyricimonas aerilata]